MKVGDKAPTFTCLNNGLAAVTLADTPAKARLFSVVAGNLIACMIALPLAFPIGAARAIDWALVIFLLRCASTALMKA